MFKKHGKVLALAIAAVMMVPFAAAAQEESGPVALATAVSPTFGEHLTTGDNLALYIFVEDEENLSTCVDACTNNWPPFLAGEDGNVELADNVNADLVATFEREDGSMQVSYAGQPLYTSRRDVPGETRGQRIGRDIFNLVSLEGQAITEEVEQEVVVVDEEILEQLMADGEAVYRIQCAVCHGAEARGGVGPGLANNVFVGNTSSVIEQILNGFPDHGMPAFRGVLDDHQIASLLTFVRSSFGNDYVPVLEEEVAERR